MKNISIISIFILAVLTGKSSIAQDGYYGEKIDDRDALTMQELVKKMEGQKSAEVKVTGKVEEVCQEMGCWMTLDKGDGTDMRVRMKGHSFLFLKTVQEKWL